MNSGWETIADHYWYKYGLSDLDLNIRTFRQLGANGVEIAAIKRRIAIAHEAIVRDINKFSGV